MLDRMDVGSDNERADATDEPSSGRNLTPKRRRWRRLSLPPPLPPWAVSTRRERRLACSWVAYTTVLDAEPPNLSLQRNAREPERNRGMRDVATVPLQRIHDAAPLELVERALQSCEHRTGWIEGVP